MLGIGSIHLHKTDQTSSPDGLKSSQSTVGTFRSGIAQELVMNIHHLFVE